MRVEKKGGVDGEKAIPHVESGGREGTKELGRKESGSRAPEKEKKAAAAERYKKKRSPLPPGLALISRAAPAASYASIH